MSRNIVAQLLELGVPLRNGPPEFDFQRVSGFRQAYILHPDALQHWYERDRTKRFKGEAQQVVLRRPLQFWLCLFAATNRPWAASQPCQFAIKQCLPSQRCLPTAVPYERFVSRHFDAYPQNAARRVERSA